MATLHMALPFFLDAGIAQDNLKNKPARPSASRRVGPTESELTRARSDVIQKIKETRAGAEKLLALHETERQRALERYEQQRELYYQGLIARNDVLKAEDALAQAIVRINEDKRWLALHPESAEGRSVLNYLRQAGIPFIAFRNAVPGAATGAHIHIGKPSPRN